MSEQEAVDVTGLSLQQLAEIRKQLEAEVDHLSESSAKLQQALAKFIDCAQSVKTVSTAASNGTELMVPLTSSLYVPGRMSETRSFIVDVGTNYFVEKTGDEAITFFENKVESLNKNLVSLDKLLNEKVTTLRNIDSVFKLKYSEAQKEAQAQQAS